MRPNRKLIAVILLIAAFSLGGVAGGALMERLTWAIADEDTEERARCARALFNALDHAVGHDEAIRRWREEIRRSEQPPRKTVSVEAK